MELCRGLSARRARCLSGVLTVPGLRVQGGGQNVSYYSTYHQDAKLDG